MTLFLPILRYGMSVMLNWSTHIEGWGLTSETARREVMAKALSKGLKEPSMRRVEIALSGGIDWRME